MPPPAPRTRPAAPPVLPRRRRRPQWWLARNTKGQTGWIYSHMIDVTAPDTLARYAEGQRIVGAYVLAHVQDPDSGILDHGQTVTDIAEYVTVLSPYEAGLPYDFNQVRVFVWNLRKHRYETAFRENNIAGYLPVELAHPRSRPRDRPDPPRPSHRQDLPSGGQHLPPHPCSRRPHPRAGPAAIRRS